MASTDEVRSKVSVRIWQSMAQSGVEVSSIPPDQLQTLVNSITDGVLVAVDEVLTGVDSTAAPYRTAPTSTDDHEEVILWEGRPFLSLVESYMLTTERLRITRGLVSRDRQDIELVRVQDIDHKQNMIERVLNLGDIYIKSHDPTAPEVTLRNVSNPMEVHEVIRRAMVDSRRRHGLHFQEEM